MCHVVEEEEATMVYIFLLDTFNKFFINTGSENKYVVLYKKSYVFVFSN
jgi:hypothetical protein